MIQQVGNRFAQPRVRLHFVLGKLRFHPLVQFFHHRRTVFPMEKQPAFRRQLSLARQCIVMINATQRLEYMPALLRKVLRHFDNLAPAMR
ncbi:MAG TPA: hypothetical protein VGF82_26870, partial [Terracidiphilus sp.]